MAVPVVHAGEVGRPTPPAASSLEKAWFPWAVLGGLVVLALPFAALTAFTVAREQAADPPSCYGLGFGCVPGPWDTAFLLGVLVYVPALLVLGIVVLVSHLLGPAWNKARSVLTLAGAVVVVFIALIAVLNAT